MAQHTVSINWTFQNTSRKQRAAYADQMPVLSYVYKFNEVLPELYEIYI